MADDPSPSSADTAPSAEKAPLLVVDRRFRVNAAVGAWPLASAPQVGAGLFEALPDALASSLRDALEAAVARREATCSRGPPPLQVTPVIVDGEVVALCVQPLPLAADDAGTARALRSAQARLDAAVAATGVGYWDADLETGEVLWSPRMLEINGLDHPMDFDDYTEQVVHPDDRSLSRANFELLMREGSFTSETRILVRGEVRCVLSVGHVIRDARGQPTRIVGGQLDVTTQRARDEQLSRNERMALVGQLTAGVAHNFNNILMSLCPDLEHIAAEGEGELQQRARRALETTRRAAGIVGQLMAVAGRQPGRAPDPLPLAAPLGEAVSMCGRIFPAQLRVECEDPGRLAVYCEEDQLLQLLLTLLLNARDALRDASPPGTPAPNGGTHPSERGGHVVVAVQAVGESVDISVTDNGPGVAPEIAARLFEPFVSSKGSEGSGLGLASCAAITRRLGGTIRHERPAEGGARFVIRLRRAADAPSGAAPSGDRHEAAQPTAAMADITGLRVLIVEDEPIIRESIATIMRRRGATVHATASVRATLSWLERAEDVIDVVLLDRSLPGESGAALVPELRQRRPEAAILYFTGEPVSPADSREVDGVIHKPIRSRELLSRVAEAAAARA